MALREYDFEKEPTVSVVKKILNDAIKMKATDIHFDPTEEELNIKFRINGELILYTVVPENVKVNIITRVKILAGMNITESLMPQLGSINIESDSKNHTMRVSSLPIADGEKVVCHITNYSNSVKSVKKLGFNEEDVRKINDILREKQGIVLVTGSGNSGKTTTMYSILKELNTDENNIITVEDPISMKIKGINQVEICPEKGITYKNVLKNILMQDPNIIGISELVDDEVARFALRASISGRLVVSSLQSKTIFQTIENLLHMDVENYLLGSNLKGIISQRLVKRLCPMCREKKKASEYEINVIKKITGRDIKELYYPSGCDDCKDGYIGVIPVEEVIKVDSELRHAISNKKSLELIKNIIYEENLSLVKDGFYKVLSGDTSFQEIIRIIDLDEDFKDDEEIRNLLLGKEITASDSKSDGKEDKVNKKSKKKEEVVVPTPVMDEEDDDEVVLVYDDNDDKDIVISNDDDFDTDEDEEKVNLVDEDTEEEVDASVKAEDAKELLNRLMAKSKKKKNGIVREVNQEESNQDLNTGGKKSTFNLSDVSIDDNDDFDYGDYEEIV